MGGNSGCRRSRTANEKLAIALCASKGDAVVAVTQIELNVRIHSTVAVWSWRMSVLRSTTCGIPRS
jgi:hypothetical protein